MNYETDDTAACAASDLAARLVAELAVASARLAAAEQRLQAASEAACTANAPIPFPERRQRFECQQQVTLLRRVLAGLPPVEGDDHAESA